MVKKMGGVAWTQEEDLLLKKCIERYGEGKWHRIPLLAGLNRCRKSCRLRWLNYLRPNIKRGSFTEEEADLIIKLHKLLGNRWSLIAGRLPGRTANDVKNYWNCHLSKKLNADQLSADKIKETIDLAMKNAESMRPQPSNLISRSVLRQMGTEEVLNCEPYLPLSKEIITTPTPWIYTEEGQGQEHQIYPAQKDNYNTSPCVEFDHGMVGDLSMDFHFEDVRVHDNNNIYDWDDLISDMDLWSSSP